MYQQECKAPFWKFYPKALPTSANDISKPFHSEGYSCTLACLGWCDHRGNRWSEIICLK